MSSEKKVILVGTGIKSISHITKETELCIKNADVVLFLVNEPVLSEWIESNAQQSFSLEQAYFSEENRIEAYKKISDTIVGFVDSHNHICVVFYGHPTVYVESGLQALKLIEERGVESVVFPAVSAEDCLFADLKIDPSNGGCFSVDATELLQKNKNIDITSHLVVWQIGMVCRDGLPSKEVNIDGLIELQSKLCSAYTPSTEAYIYEASLYAGVSPKINRIKIENLHKEVVTPISTLYVPPTDS